MGVYCHINMGVYCHIDMGVYCDIDIGVYCHIDMRVTFTFPASGRALYLQFFLPSFLTPTGICSDSLYLYLTYCGAYWMTQGDPWVTTG